jgi:fermentation-respiration switch protein FrsA (DUF1100 family)
MRRFSCFLLLVMLAAVGCTSGPLGRYERSVVYQPSNAEVGDWARGQQLGFEEVKIASSGETKLHGWYFDHPERQAVVLFLHGNGGNVATWAEPVRELAERHRLSVLLFDYRGYGKSNGEPTEFGLRDDADAARTWLARRTDVAEQSIVLFGQSLGGAVAVDAATNGKPPRGLVLVSTFTSAPKVASHHIPWLPAGLVMSQRFPSESRLKEYERPLLVSHGDADRVIPFEQGEKLFAAAASKEKQFVRHVGGDHNDPLPRQFHEAFAAFLQRLPAERPYQQPAMAEIRFEPERIMPAVLRR